MNVLRSPYTRLGWCLAGATSALALALFLTGPVDSPLFLASLGGTSVFLFGLTRAPATQPRALFGGHLGAALIGIACYQMLGESLCTYVLALVLALAWMLLTRTMHPPAGANPLLMVHAHAGWGALWHPVLLGIVTLVAVASLWTRLYPGLARYPVEPNAPSPARLDWGGWDD